MMENIKSDTHYARNGIQMIPHQLFLQSKIWFCALSIFIIAPVSAFKDAEHQAVTQDAAIHAALDGASDIGFYQNLIVSWSYGIGFTGNPAERLAHESAQAVGGSVYNGGQFTTLYDRAQQEYLNFNFASQTPGNEGAYVLLGACAHLIEDQASMPHAANVFHGLSDKDGTVSGLRIELLSTRRSFVGAREKGFYDA